MIYREIRKVQSKNLIKHESDLEDCFVVGKHPNKSEVSQSPKKKRDKMLAHVVNR